MLKINQIKMPISYTQQELLNKVADILKINANLIEIIEIYKKSIDARKKTDVCYCLTVLVNLTDKNLEKSSNFENFTPDYSGISYEKISSDKKIVVVGFGPSGIFCALALAKMGLKPIVIEQGEDVDKRKLTVKQFWETGKLNKFSNVQFGEGGAGTFSDGKLNTNLNNEYCKKVINEFYLHGAPKDILITNKPHIGSDILPIVVKNIRTEIESLGGKVLFGNKLTDIQLEENCIKSLSILPIETNEVKEIETDYLVLCLGHSARDSFKMLYDKKMTIKQKPFAMGVRIEQSAKQVNEMQYGKNYDKNLPNADYKFAVHLDNQRSVFTFCMCPGGVVVASSSNDNEIVTNGMSYFARDKETSNSALLVNVLTSDYESSHPLAGIYFQAKYEKLAYELGGGDFCAPAETVGSFIGGNVNKIKKCSYSPNVKEEDLTKCLPKFVSESLKLGICELNKRYKTFAKDDNILIGIESRSSCPLTLLRDENYESSIKNIYPCGEGAGYAGGIVSSAQDGIKVAESIYKNIKGD